MTEAKKIPIENGFVRARKIEIFWNAKRSNLNCAFVAVTLIHFKSSSFAVTNSLAVISAHMASRWQSFWANASALLIYIWHRSIWNANIAIKHFPAINHCIEWHFYSEFRYLYKEGSVNNRNSRYRFDVAVKFGAILIFRTMTVAIKLEFINIER